MSPGGTGTVKPTKIRTKLYVLADSVVNLQLTIETQRRSTFLWFQLRNLSIALTRLLGTPDPLRGKRPVELQLHCGGVGSAPTEICPTGKTKPQRSISVKRIGQIGSGKMRVHECVWKVLFPPGWAQTWWRRIARLTQHAVDAERKKRRKIPAEYLVGSFQQVWLWRLCFPLKVWRTCGAAFSCFPYQYRSSGPVGRLDLDSVGKT